MTETWPLVPLRVVTAEAQTGPFGSQLHSYEYIDDGVPVINPSNIRDGKLFADSQVTITDEKASTLKTHRLIEGDLIFARRGELGRAAVVTEEAAGWLCGTGSLRVRIRSGALDHRFAGYVLQSARTRGYFEMQAVGSTMENLNTSIVLSLPIPRPPIREQQRVANFLDAKTTQLDRSLMIRKQQRELLWKRTQIVITREYDDAVDKYGSTRLRYLLRGIEQGWSPDCDNREASPDEWGVIKAGCVNGGVFRPEENKTLPIKTRPRLEYTLKQGDLLMSRASGSLNLIGSAAIIPHLNRKLLLCDKVYRLRVDHHKVDPEYIALMLRSVPMREQIRLGVSGASGLANNLPIPIVLNLPVPNPPLDVQHDTIESIEKSLAAIEYAQFALQKQCELLGERRQALITAAVTGQIDV